MDLKHAAVLMRIGKRRSNSYYAVQPDFAQALLVP